MSENNGNNYEISLEIEGGEAPEIQMEAESGESSEIRMRVQSGGGGTAFDGGYVDSGRQLHFTLDGEDVEEITPIEIPDSDPDNIGAVRYDQAQNLTEAQKAQARQNIGADAGAVKYDAAQELTAEQKAQARTNIGAASTADVNGAVTSVTENGGVITVTKKNGATNTIQLPQGLDFDGGYCAADESTGKTYLHLTKTVSSGGVETAEDVEGFEPIELPTGGPSGVEYDSSYYLHFYDANGEEMYDGPFLIEGGGGGGGATSILSLDNIVKVSTIRNGAAANFSFTATASDDTDITVKWYVDGVLQETDEGESGDTFAFNAQGLLKESDTSIVKAAITSEGGGSLNRQWAVTSTAFSLSWGAAIQPITLYTANENVYAVVIVAAQAGTTNTVTVAVGNHSRSAAVTGSRAVTIELDKSWFAIGANTVTANMVSGTDSSDTADEISYVAVWAYGATDPIVAFETDELAGVQYDTIPIRYMAYTPGSETSSCTITIGEESPRAITADRTMRTLEYVYNEAMTEDVELAVVLACGESEAELTLTVTRSDYNIGAVGGDSLRYHLNPVGHSNADADRTNFGNLTFSSGFDWVNGGFQTDEDGATAFVVKKGHRATLPRSLFADADANGKVIDVSFRIRNSDQYNAVAMQDLNNSSTKGLILRSNEGEVRLDNVAGQVFRYCEDSRIDLSIYVEEITEQRISTIWLDGIPSKVDAYEAGTLVHTENPLVIGSDHCDVWVYAIRCYNAVLSETEMVQNWIASGSTTAEKVERCIRNAIYDANDKITPATLHAAMPALTIVEIEMPRMTTSKSDPVPADITITDGTTKLELAAASAPDASDGALIKGQGTSSAAYGRSSYNMDLDFKGTGKKYRISSGSLQVNYLNIKVNVASSENANNVCAVDWYNTFQPYLTEPRSRDGVRDTVEGKPCAVFIKNNGNTAAWFSSQLVQPDETVLYAMGDLCNSKKNKAVFGQDGSGEHPTLGCVEVSGNDTAAERFEATSTYNAEDGEWQTNGLKDFEWRMEPTSANLQGVVDAWDDAVEWVVGTIGDAATFKSEIGDYFAIDSLLYHFLMIEFFAAYDDVSKNTFYSYDWDETAGKYLWNIKAAYDWDTILAADNDGKPFGDYGLDYGDTVDGTAQGRSYFNAVTNTIWVNIKAAYQAELSAMYRTLRSSGAWDSDGVIRKWEEYQARRPHAAMVRDAYIKYVYPYKTSGMVIGSETLGHDDSYLPRMQGSKTYWRRQFMTYQQAYMDGKYGYYSTSNAVAFRTNCESGNVDFTVKCYAKTYITALVDSTKVASLKIQAGGTATFEDISVGSNTTLYFTPARLIQYIRPLNETDNSTFVASGAVKLMEAILGSAETNSAWLSGTGLSIPSAILKDLSIRNLENFSSALNLSANTELETLDTRGTSAGRITLPSYGPVKSLQLNAITGIVAQNLTQVTTFTLASGENLISVRVENCNSLIMNAILDYLEDAESSIQYLRLAGVNWTLEDTELLNKLLTVGRISDSGEAGDPPCIITGSIYVPVVRSGEYAAYQAAWPGVVTYGQLITQHAVTFLNWDDSPILDNNGNAYVQYVDAGENAHDPIQAGEVPTPTRAADSEYAYTFDDWDSLPIGVIGSETVHATYTAATQSYTVQWYDGIGAGDGTLLEAKQGISYGGSAEPTNPFPTYTALEQNNVYYVFDEWDRSTGYITGDTKVHAKWIIGNLPQISAGILLKNMSWAQRSAVAKRGLCDAGDTVNPGYWQPGEYMDFTMGRDFDFDSGDDPTVPGYVEGIDLVSESTWFSGNAAPIIFNGQGGRPSLQLFNGSIPRWTLAIDYEFAADTGVLAGCFNDDGNKGFSFRRSGNYTNVLWGDSNLNTGYQYQRGMLVIRHNGGKYPLVLYVASDGNTSANIYPISTAKPESNVINTAVARAVSGSCDAPLTLGGVGFMDGSDVTSLRGKGWIHWAKLWKDDIGLANAGRLAAMPHIDARYTFTRIRYRDGLDGATVVAGGFMSEGLLPQLGAINSTNTNSGGWPDTHRRKWLNGQFFEGLPVPLQAMIREARVRSTAGGGSSSSPSRGIVNSMDKVYLAAYAELFSSETGSGYIDELDDGARRIPYFTTDTERGLTSVNYARIRIPGFIIPEDANFCVSNVDPTTAGLGFTVHHGKTVWINTTDSSRGLIYVNADYAAKHLQLGGRLTSNSANKDAVGADSDGGTGGKWIASSHWWSRSPIVTYSTTFMTVSNYGGSNNTTASYTYGLAPAFSI